MLELWGRANAYNVQKPMWLLSELDLDYRHYDVGSNPGDLDTPEFLALNPHGKVPVLRDGDAVVWESHAVLRYLANRFEAHHLYPQDAHARSLVERWMDWGHTAFQPVFMDLFWGYYRMPPAQRDHEAIEAARAGCQQVFRTLDQRLDHSAWLADEDFSLAEITIGVSLYRYFNMGLEVEQPPAVMQWYQRLSQRAPFRATIMQPFGELEGRTEY